MHRKIYAMKSKKLPHYLIEKNNLIVQVTISVLFAIAFLAVYIPLSNTTTSWFSLEDQDKFVYTAFFIIASTIFLIFSRILMFYMSKRLIRFTLPKYILWTLGEIVLIGLFHAYISLGIIHVENYIEGYSKAIIIGKSILITFIALGFPFIVTDLSFALLDAQRVLRIARSVVESILLICSMRCRSGSIGLVSSEQPIIQAMTIQSANSQSSIFISVVIISLSAVIPGVKLFDELADVLLGHFLAHGFFKGDARWIDTFHSGETSV